MRPPIFDPPTRCWRTSSSATTASRAPCDSFEAGRDRRGCRSFARGRAEQAPPLHTMEDQMARLIRTLAIAAVITAATASAGAQPPPGGGPGGRVGGGARGPITLTGDIETIRHATLDFIGGEIPLGPIVRGAPFSGEGVTTSS